VRAELQIARIAARQHGVVTRAQLIDAGISPSAIHRRVERLRLVVVQSGVYQVGPLAAPHGREMAAVLACGPTSAVSHTSAASLWRLLPVDAAAPVHVTIGGSDRGHRPGIEPHRARTLPADEVARWRGIRLTTPARTLIDIAACVGECDLERALARAARRGLADQDVLALVNRRPRRPGAAILRALLAGEAALTRSEAEVRFRALIARAQLPDPELNARIMGYEVDALWRDRRIVVEVDGFAFHRSRASFESDRNRDAVLTAAGFTVTRITWRQLEREPEAVVARLAVALTRSGALWESER
jgi:very-short-patch-repair endonuclease